MSKSRVKDITRVAVAGIAMLACILFTPMADAQEATDSIAIPAYEATSLDPGDSYESESQSPSGRVPLRRQRIAVEDDSAFSQTTQRMQIVNIAGDTISIAADSVPQLMTAEIILPQSTDSIAPDTTAVAQAFTPRRSEYNPDPTRAVWLSALFPGLGQIYNRKFWKLPIVVGGYVGLAYATSWNNGMLKDYTKAYSDAMDNDPNTNSYMDFYPSTTKEEDINMTWLKKVLKSKKDFYRRYRDICIISMVGLYLVCMIDAYVDASMAHFDISPDLAIHLNPIVIEQRIGSWPAWGVQCAVTF